MTWNRAWSIALTLLLLALAASPVLAAPGSPPQLVIVSASADVAAGTLTIVGTEFGDEPVVTLNATPLTVVTSTPSQIDATLPPGLAPGSYLLTVSRGPATTQFDAFNVTLGAAGPQGPPGGMGAPGPPGTFTGHFQSPNGQYSLDVTDTGIRLSGPGSRIEIANGTVTIMSTNVVVRSDVNTEIRAGANATLRADASLNIRAGASTDIQSGANTTISSAGTTAINGAITSVDGGLLSLNGSSARAARTGDAVQVDPVTGVGVITGGSISVFIGN